MNWMSKTLPKFCPRLWLVPICNAFPSGIIASIVVVYRAPANFSLSVLTPMSTGMARYDSTRSLYSLRAYITSASASSAVAWAVFPSCQRNSLVRRKSLVALVSHLTMLHHWLILTGKSLQLRIHLAKVAYIIVSDVGLMASFFSSGGCPPGG